MSEQPQISTEDLLKAETEIVLEDLEAECARHASKVAFWTYQNSLAKDACKKAEAQANISIRQNPPKEIAKATEAVWDSLVTLDTNVSATRHEVARTGAFVVGFEHRRDMLKSLCQLRLIEARNSGDIRPT